MSSSQHTTLKRVTASRNGDDLPSLEFSRTNNGEKENQNRASASLSAAAFADVKQAAAARRRMTSSAIQSNRNR